MLCGAISLNVAFFLSRFPLHRSPHEIKQEWKLEQEIEKRGPVVETAVPTAISSEHASLIHSPDARVPCRIILAVLEGKILSITLSQR